MWRGFADVSRRERYGNGECMYLALTLHERFRFPIEAAIRRDTCGEYIEYIKHAWVVDGSTALDTDGSQSAVTMRETYACSDTTVAMFTPSALIRKFDWGGFSESTLAIARRAVAEQLSSEVLIIAADSFDRSSEVPEASTSATVVNVFEMSGESRCDDACDQSQAAGID